LVNDGTGRSDALTEYRRKRDFRKTPEPAGDRAPARADAKLRFVIQKHDASSLHYDLRLECDGVMKSWAVPRGLSADPADKRLAMEVEDHPIEYNTFEGTIPKAEYGGGTVLLWDRGSYYPDETRDEDDEAAVRTGLAEGKLSFTLLGERLKGSFALVRTDGGAKAKWLVIKHRDRFAKPGFDITAAYETSVESGRTLKDIAADRESETWSSAAIAPMTARPAAAQPLGPEWVYDRLYAGTRLHVYATADAVRLVAHGRDVTRRYADLVERLGEVVEHAGQGFVMDGILTDDAVSTFRAFDLLFDGGDILLAEPWRKRRSRLEALVEEFGVEGVELSEIRKRGGRSLTTNAAAAGWTGLVAKRIESAYHPGEAAGDWIAVDLARAAEIPKT
jgi:bifunctional non-homologous end joining protein LigD